MTRPGHGHGASIGGGLRLAGIAGAATVVMAALVDYVEAHTPIAAPPGGRITVP